MKKGKIAMFLLVILLVIFGYRYYKVNHNVPLKYTMEYYKDGNYADCEGLQIKILSTETRKSNAKNKVGTEFMELVVKSEIVNNTSEVKNAISFQESDIVIDCYSVSTGPPEVTGGDLKNIKPGEKLLLTQVYTLEKERYEKGKDNVYMYLREKLYPNEIKEKFYKGIRYRKAIKI
ncbi:hypothetical protein [Clostridium sp. KNHs214]|uniref:hypothetical protein n=1 Tax=Clostridium sp. KNHs214 TaxID=1540257 RepID=UPI00054F0217|nr:hypothetical protein [Clostridium sp. KNHs214]